MRKLDKFNQIYESVVSSLGSDALCQEGIKDFLTGKGPLFGKSLKERGDEAAKDRDSEAHRDEYERLVACEKLVRKLKDDRAVAYVRLVLEPHELGSSIACKICGNVQFKNAEDFYASDDKEIKNACNDDEVKKIFERSLYKAVIKTVLNDKDWSKFLYWGVREGFFSKDSSERDHKAYFDFDVEGYLTHILGERNPNLWRT